MRTGPPRPGKPVRQRRPVVQQRLDRQAHQTVPELSRPSIDASLPGRFVSTWNECCGDTAITANGGMQAFRSGLTAQSRAPCPAGGQAGRAFAGRGGGERRFWAMVGKRPTAEHRHEALWRVLAGLAQGDDALGIAASVAGLHRAGNTTWAWRRMRLAAEALDCADVGREDPIRYEGLLERYLPECEFHGRQNQKIKFVVLGTASLRGGLEPDLLGEVIWWQSDDFWRYALYAAVAIIRSCADKESRSLADFAGRLADRQGVDIR